MEIDVQAARDRLEGAREHRRPSDYALLLENKIAVELARHGLFLGNKESAQYTTTNSARKHLLDAETADSKVDRFNQAIEEIRIKGWPYELSGDERNAYIFDSAVIAEMYAIEAYAAECAGREREAWTLILDGENWLKGITASWGIKEGDRIGAKGRASKGAGVKLANDPKQAAKEEVFQMWKAWQAGEVRHASGAAFARYVVENTVIEDTNTVQRWMREWRKQHGRS